MEAEIRWKQSGGFPLYRICPRCDDCLHLEDKEASSELEA